MQQLLNELTSGFIEIREDGTSVTKAPSLLTLRAARAIKQLVDQNNQHIASIESLQEQYLTQHSTIQAYLDQIYHLKEDNESLRKNQRKTSNVGNSGHDNSRKHRSSEEGGQTKVGNPCTS
jgi:hypothetical protein